MNLIEIIILIILSVSVHADTITQTSKGAMDGVVGVVVGADGNIAKGYCKFQFPEGEMLTSNPPQKQVTDRAIDLTKAGVTVKYECVPDREIK